MPQVIVYRSDDEDFSDDAEKIHPLMEKLMTKSLPETGLPQIHTQKVLKNLMRDVEASTSKNPVKPSTIEVEEEVENSQKSLDEELVIEIIILLSK